jgi:hypothetical protein
MERAVRRQGTGRGVRHPKMERAVVCIHGLAEWLPQVVFFRKQYMLSGFSFPVGKKIKKHVFTAYARVDHL